MHKTDFVHFYEMAVRWSDQDVLGHVNNVELLRYLESGRVAYCAEVLQLHFTPAIKEGWILADMQCSFRRQLRYPATITVATRTGRLGNSSADMLAAIFDGDELIASAKAVCVWFDYQVQKSKAIPDGLRAAVQRFERLPPA